MAILVLNVGSSSLKAAVFDASGTERLWSASRSGVKLPGDLDTWLGPALDPWWSQISRAGHRVVHGGERFQAPTPITPSTLPELEALSPLAPLHNPPALTAIRWLQQQRPDLPQWACFDTAFHATLPEAAYSYAIPQELRSQGYRRFGFHGINHQHVSQLAPGPRLISVHLGAGCSVAAIAGGQCIDTSMGFTPMEGLVMATRSGSIDPGLLLALLHNGMGVSAVDDVLNHHSGLAGLSGLSGDWKELRGAAVQGHSGAQLAIQVFLHRLKAGIAAMASSLGGVDQIALTGGIGSNDSELLEQLKDEMSWLGTPQWLQIAADEEGMIARLISDREDRGFGATSGSDAGDRH